jgi:hypothetical protein
MTNDTNIHRTPVEGSINNNQPPLNEHPGPQTILSRELITGPLSTEISN